MHRNKPIAKTSFIALLIAWITTPVFAGDVVIPTADSVTPQIPATLTTPEGAGPFPAIVVMHDCSGLGPRSSGSPGRWAKELLANGYAVILPDSFTPRGHPGGICTEPPQQRHPGVVPSKRAEDAYATLAYLRTRPDLVDATRIGIMGGSHGGASTLATMVLTKANASPGSGFIAGVALYPACAANYGAWRTDMTGRYETAKPLLILIGELDDWTPAANCRKLANSAQGAGQPVTLKVYPGAHHSFDSPYPERYSAARVNPNAPGRRGATTGGQAEAWADSIREVIGFFARTLAK
jgi:dienelactone hydrolase